MPIIDKILGQDITVAALILGLAILFYPLIKALANIIQTKIVPVQAKSNAQLYQKFSELKNNDLNHIANALNRVESKLEMAQGYDERSERLLERMADTLNRIDIKMK